MKIIATIAATALLLGGAAVPAHAAEDPDPDSCAAEMQQIAQLADEVTYWRGRADEANAIASERATAAVERASAAEDRSERLAGTLGERTAQRDRLLVRAQRLEVQRDRLRIKVQRLRERLSGTRTLSSH